VVDFTTAESLCKNFPLDTVVVKEKGPLKLGRNFLKKGVDFV
jgi:hypothetical protein